MSNIGIPTQVLTQVFQGQGSDKYLAVLNMYLHRSTHRYGNVLYDNDGHSFISLTSLNTCTFCVVLVSSKVLEVFGKVFLEYIVFGTNEQDLRNFQSEKVLQLCIRQAIIFNLQPLHLRATAATIYQLTTSQLPFENVEKRLLSSVQSWYSGALPKASKPRSFSYNVAATPKWAPSCQLLRERKISTVSNGFSKGRKKVDAER